MRSLLSPVGAALLLGEVVGASPAAMAQDGTPRSSPQADGGNAAGRLDLAAMALGAEDIPATYGLYYEEYLTRGLGRNGSP